MKASYMRTRQYLHLVSNTTSATPVDVWKPAGKYVEPATSDQYALGYFRNLKANMYEFSAKLIRVIDGVLELKFLFSILCIPDKTSIFDASLEETLLIVFLRLIL